MKKIALFLVMMALLLPAYAGHQRLLGTWKSNKPETLACFKAHTKPTPAQLEKLGTILGKLSMTIDQHAVTSPRGGQEFESIYRIVDPVALAYAGVALLVSLIILVKRHRVADPCLPTSIKSAATIVFLMGALFMGFGILLGTLGAIPRFWRLVWISVVSVVGVCWIWNAFRLRAGNPSARWAAIPFLLIAVPSLPVVGWIFVPVAAYCLYINRNARQFFRDGGATSRQGWSSPANVKSPQAKEITPRQRLAMLLFMLTGPFMALSYWQSGGNYPFIGAIPVHFLLWIAMVGGAVSFVTYNDGMSRWISIIPGALAGFGAFGLLHFLTVSFKPERIYRAEFLVLLFVSVIGAAPGFLLNWGLIKLFKTNKSSTQSRIRIKFN